MLLIVCGSSRSGTTITMKILNTHKDIQLLNESRVFWDDFILRTNPAKKYFKKIYNRVCSDLKYHRAQTKYDFKRLFMKDVLSNLKEDNTFGRANAFHDTLINGFSTKYVGNKGADPQTLFELEKAGVDFRLIYIHRDGRDVASSGVRHKRKNMTPPWSTSAKDNAAYWGERVKKFLDGKHQLDPKKFIILKFEDYVDNSGTNMRKVEQLLGVQGLVPVEKKKINLTQSHKGYFSEWCPDWLEVFPSVAVNSLRRLNYIKE